MNDVPHQLDLFSADGGTAPAARVMVARDGRDTSIIVPFPLPNRADMVGVTAGALLKGKTREAKEAFWRRTLRGLDAELRTYGIERAEIDRQLSMFRIAVGNEMAARTEHGGSGTAA